MSIIEILVVVCLTSGSLITGLLFCFSNCALQSLGDMDQSQGALAMQIINRKIQNPLFLALFLGSPLLCGAVMALLIFGSFHILLFMGCLLHVVGPFGITVIFNVPLNQRLDQLEGSEAADFWPQYQQQWQFWNHVRTTLGVLSVFTLALGLALHR